MSDAGFCIASKQPTIKFVRPLEVEPDARLSLYWNGTRAPNGDAVPGEGDPIDYGMRIVGPVPVWPAGKQPQLFGGAFGDGDFAGLGGGGLPGMEFCGGMFGDGYFGWGASFWSWKSHYPWRDGVYRIAARLSDALGNERGDDAGLLVVRILAVPRPAENLGIDAFDAGTQVLSLRLDRSPEFAAAA